MRNKSFTILFSIGVMFVLLACASLICGQDTKMNGEGLLSGWSDFKVTKVETPNGAAYLGYVVGVLHGSYVTSGTVDHLPNLTGHELALTVGAYLEAHKHDPGFKEAFAPTIILSAILARWPPPAAKGKV